MRLTTSILGLILLLPAATAAHDGDVHHVHREFNLASELVSWCRDEAEAHALGTGRTTYQWTSSHSDRGSELKVEGRLHVEGGDLVVTCRSARGAREDYATIDIVERTR